MIETSIWHFRRKQIDPDTTRLLNLVILSVMSRICVWAEYDCRHMRC